VEDFWRTSPALRTSEEVIGTTLVVLAGPSIAILPPKDRPEVMAPLTLMALVLGPHVDSRGWMLLSFFHLATVQGSWEVLAPRGLPPSSSRHLRDGLVLILNWDFSSEGAVDVALGYGDFLGELEELKVLPLKEWRRRMKNGVFRVSDVITLSGVIFLGVI